jgi:hypothetical protein
MLSFPLDRHEFDRIRAGLVTLHLNLAMTQLTAGKGVEVILDTSGEFSLPNVGICSFSEAYAFTPAELHCRVAFHQPNLTHISAPVSTVPCNQSQSSGETEARFSDWVGALDQDPADFGLTPVWTTGVSFAGTGSSGLLMPRPGSTGERSYICDGAPLLLTPYHVVRRFRYEVNVPGITLPAPSTGIGAGG